VEFTDDIMGWIENIQETREKSFLSVSKLAIFDFLFAVRLINHGFAYIEKNVLITVGKPINVFGFRFQ